jgi:hypothetical protein
VNLNKLTIGVRTFLRDAKLMNTIAALRNNFSDAKIAVADCGEHTDEKDGVYADLRREGHTVIQMDFDAGLGAMSNVLVDALNTDYFLLASDDFDFKPASVRTGIEEMVRVLDLTDIDIAGGRVRGPYEFDLEDLGDTIIEHPVNIRCERGGILPWFVHVDLLVNYWCAKKDVFSKVRWMDTVKIGGSEHSYIFIQAKRAGLKTAYVPGVEIKEQEGEDSLRYRQYRGRANRKERECMDAIGVKRYILGSGQVDYQCAS